MTGDFDVREALIPVRRAMMLRRVLRWSVAGLALGAGIAAAALLVLRVHGGTVMAAPLLLLAVIPVAGALLALVLRPDFEEAARRTDRHFGLQDRLTTALEFRASNEPLMLLQRRQAGAAISGQKLRSGAGPWISRREVGAAALAFVFAAGLFLAPAPSTSHATRASAAELARIRKLAAQEIPAIERKLPRQNLAAMKQARQVLARLQFQLRHAQTKTAALRSISEAQRALQRIRSHLKPVDPSSAQTLARQLGSYIPEHRGPADLRAAKALTSIAKKLNRATPHQRARMAQDLLKAANATRDRTTRSLLHKAASAVGYGDRKRAQSALKKASSRLRRSTTARKARSGLSRSGNGLDMAKYQLSPSRIGKLQGASLGNEQTKFNHEPGNALSPSQQGAANRPIVNRNLNASGLNNKRNLAESGEASDSGGFSQGKQQEVSGHGHAKRFGVVYLPGKLSKGTYSVQLGPNGKVAHLSPAAYQRILARYARSTAAAVGHTSLPPDLQTYVRRYFVVLSHP